LSETAAKATQTWFHQLLRVTPAMEAGIRCTPAMEAGVATSAWTVQDLVGMAGA